MYRCLYREELHRTIDLLARQQLPEGIHQKTSLYCVAIFF